MKVIFVGKFTLENICFICLLTAGSFISTLCDLRNQVVIFPLLNKLAREFYFYKSWKGQLAFDFHLCRYVKIRNLIKDQL